jgi:sporulation protein YlmC with PRC-barrel domain
MLYVDRGAKISTISGLRLRMATRRDTLRESALVGKENSMPQQVTIKKTDPEKRYRRVLSASTLAGDRVRNSAGEDLGKVHEIMIDIPSGQVAYAVLSFGGFLGMGDKLFALPWKTLTVDEDEKCFVLNIDRQKLESAPGFDKDNWPDMADAVWGTAIFSYYGTRPYWQEYE